MYKEIREAFENVNVLKDVSNCVSAINQTEIIERSLLSDIQLGTGSINVEITFKRKFILQCAYRDYWC